MAFVQICGAVTNAVTNAVTSRKRPRQSDQQTIEDLEATIARLLIRIEWFTRKIKDMEYKASVERGKGKVAMGVETAMNTRSAHEIVALRTELESDTKALAHLHTELECHKSANTFLKAENARLKDENAHLMNALASMKDELHRKSQETQRLKEEVVELHTKL